MKDNLKTIVLEMSEDKGMKFSDIANELDIDKGLVVRFVIEHREYLAKELLTHNEGVVAALLVEEKRKKIFSALKKEEGTILPLQNMLHNQLKSWEGSPESISKLFDYLPSDGSMDCYFEGLVWNANTPEDALNNMYKDNRFISELKRLGRFD